MFTMLAKTKGKHSDKYLLTHQYLPLRSPLRRILQTLNGTLVRVY